MQVALECLAHDWNLNPRVVPACYWSFVHVPVHLLMALVASLVAFARMLAGCGECQCNSAHIYDFHFRHFGMLRYRFLAVVLLAFLPGVKSGRVWQSGGTKACLHRGPAGMQRVRNGFAVPAENAGNVSLVQSLTQAPNDQSESNLMICIMFLFVALCQ